MWSDAVYMKIWLCTVPSQGSIKVSLWTKEPDNSCFLTNTVQEVELYFQGNVFLAKVNDQTLN